MPSAAEAGSRETRTVPFRTARERRSKSSVRVFHHAIFVLFPAGEAVVPQVQPFRFLTAADTFCYIATTID